MERKSKSKDEKRMTEVTKSKRKRNRKENVRMRSTEEVEEVAAEITAEQEEGETLRRRRTAEIEKVAVDEVVTVEEEVVDMRMIWFVRTEAKGRPEVEARQGGGICLSGDGWIITASCMFSPLYDRGKIVPSIETKARLYVDEGFRTLHKVEVYRELGLAVCRVKPNVGEVFVFAENCGDSIGLSPLERVMAVVHAGGALFSTQLATACFPYPSDSGFFSLNTPSPPPLEYLYSVLKSLMKKKMKTKKKSPYVDGLERTPPFRTAASTLNPKSTVPYSYTWKFRSDLPLMEVHGILGFRVPGGGMEGCPLFRRSNGQLLGLLLFQSCSSEFAIPIDIVRSIYLKEREKWEGKVDTSLDN